MTNRGCKPNQAEEALLEIYYEERELMMAARNRGDEEAEIKHYHTAIQALKEARRLREGSK